MLHKKYLFVLLGIFFLLNIEVYGWGLHYLVTDRALEKISLPESVSVEPLDSFLSHQSTEVSLLFSNYANWVRKNKGTSRFKEIPFDSKNPTALAFLRSARLDPHTQFYQVNRLMPNQTTHSRLIDYGLLSPYEKKEKNFVFLFEDVSGRSVSARSILRTFSDEPDWWFDGELWDVAEYGYGKMPYGQKNGSTGAPFHMLFRHENWIVRTFVPELTEGMTDERTELMARLSQLAFKTHHPYWGYRFAAWAIHYIQDLSQPYHSSAIPSADTFYYLRFVFSLHKEKFKADATQLVANRHYLYEDFVKVILQDSYLSETKVPQELVLALAKDFAFRGESIQELISLLSLRSFNQARSLDRAITAAYGQKMTEDPSYDMKSDSLYDAVESVTHLDPGVSELLIKETQINFELTGGVTRDLLRQVTQNDSFY